MSVYVKLCCSVKSTVSVLDHSMITSLSLQRDLCGCYSKDSDVRLHFTVGTLLPWRTMANCEMANCVSEMTVVCSYMAGHNF